jgi:iron complex outermembrane receptor protein
MTATWSKNWLRATLFGSAAAFGIAGVASAQGGAAPAQREESALEELIITAQKREENLQTVPLAITAMSGESLERQSITTFNDLQTRVPGFHYDEYSAGQPRFYARGVGNNVLSGSIDEAIGVFIDGVYLDRPAMANTDFLDLERVEVLRGPQGTLFGRNVVGGAVSFVTRRPTDQFRYGGNLTIGNYREISGGAYVSGPVTEKFFASFAATTRNRDGYAYNTTTKNDVEDAQFVGARTTLRFLPSDSVEVLLRGDVSRRRGTGVWWVLYGRGLQTAPSEITTPRRNAHQPDDGWNDVDNNGASLEVNWDLQGVKLTSLSSFRASDFANRTNLTPPNVAPGLNPATVSGNFSNVLFTRDFEEHAEQRSQEFRLTSDDAERLRWVAGLFYHHVDVA